MLDEPIVSAPEPYPRKFVGTVVEFDLRRTEGKSTRERGEVIEQRWLGLTEHGRIPEYELTIRGRSGRAARARVTRDHAAII